MRISTQKCDPGYCPQMAGKSKVFLDGKELKYCITADEEKGRAFVYKLNDDGKPYIEPGTDEAATEWLTGNVRIEI